jgi:hypothetical protein
MARDRTYKPVTNPTKYQVSQDEIDKFREDAKNAAALLNNPYLKTYFQTSKDQILEMHAKQSIYDVTEERETNGITTKMHFPAKKEYSMLAGKYRFMDEFIEDLKQAVSTGKLLDEKMKSEEIEVIPEE